MQEKSPPTYSLSPPPPFPQLGASTQPRQPGRRPLPPPTPPGSPHPPTPRGSASPGSQPQAGSGVHCLPGTQPGFSFWPHCSPRFVTHSYSRPLAPFTFCSASSCLRASPTCSAPRRPPAPAFSPGPSLTKARPQSHGGRRRGSGGSGVSPPSAPPPPLCHLGEPPPLPLSLMSPARKWVLTCLTLQGRRRTEPPRSGPRRDPHTVGA